MKQWIRGYRIFRQIHVNQGLWCGQWWYLVKICKICHHSREPCIWPSLISENSSCMGSWLLLRATWVRCSNLWMIESCLTMFDHPLVPSRMNAWHTYLHIGTRLFPLFRFSRMSLSPSTNIPSPTQYQKDFAAWDLYQVLKGKLDVQWIRFVGRAAFILGKTRESIKDHQRVSR